MTDLIKGFIYVKDPLTLFAFLSLVFLAAFKTKRVPELFFRLADKDDKAREKFYFLLHRFMVYGFIGFVLVCGVAIVSQALAFASRERPYSVEAAQKEITASSASEEQKQAALKAYSEGFDAVRKQDFDQAIQSLQASLNAVPSLSAEYTLAYLYKKKGNLPDASKHAAQAMKLAKPGDTMALVRTEQLTNSIDPDSVANSPGEQCQMVGGRKSSFPAPGKTLDDATKISPGLYISKESLGGNIRQYYKLHLKAHQTLVIDFRTPDSGGSFAGATIYDQQGSIKAEEYIHNERSTLRTVDWSPSTDEWVLFSVGDQFGVTPETLYCVSVR